MFVTMPRPQRRFSLAVPPVGRTDRVILSKTVELNPLGLQLLQHFEAWAWQHATTRQETLQVETGCVGETDLERAWFGE